MRQSSSSPSFIRSIDWVTILMYLLLVFFGWLSICGASYNFETEELLSPGGRPMMQLLWIGLGVLLGFAVLSLPISRAPARGSCWVPCAYSRQSSLR